MAYCTECGNTVSDDATFCTGCGKPTASTPPSHPAPPPSEPGWASPAPPPAQAVPPTGGVAPRTARSSVAPWLPGSWMPAIRLGSSALGIGLALQYTLGIVMVLIQVLTGAGIDWGATLRAPLTVFLSLHGPVDGLGLWASGCGWVIAAFWLTGRVQHRSQGATSLPRGAMLVVQSAVVYTVPVLLLALLFEPEALPIDLTIGIAGAFFDPAAYGGWSPGLVATLGLLIALIGSGVAVIGVRHIPALIDRIPTVVASGFVGARSLLAMAVAGVGIVVIVGVCVEVLTDGLGWTLGAAYLLTVLLAAGIWGGLDVGVAFVVFSMRFFIGDDYVLFAERPGWLLACVAVVAVAYLWGGRKAVRAHGSASRSEKILVGATTGGIAAIGLVIGAALTTGATGSLAGPAFGLGLLWSAAAVLGALSVSPDASAIPAPPPEAPAPPPVA